MAKALVFRHGSADRATELAFNLEKIDRKKLYGYVDVEVQDSAGRPCELAILGGDGRTLVGRGGSALAMLDPDGNWAERTSLKPVGISGEPLLKTESSFNAPVLLDQRASVDEYLSHNVKSLYLLTPPMGADDLLKELAGGAIYTFPFSYRGGLNPDTAFLLASSDGKPFLAVGRKTKLRFVSLAQPADLDEDGGAPEPEDDDDSMDFGMM